MSLGYQDGQSLASIARSLAKLVELMETKEKAAPVTEQPRVYYTRQAHYRGDAT